MVASADAQSSCNVPDDHGSIQLAIDDSSCDTINIDAGTFYETLAITRSVTLQGHGAESTTVDGYSSDSVFTIGDGQNAITVTLSSLSIVNGSSGSGGGVNTALAAITITDCIISENWVFGRGGAIYIDSG